MDNENCDKSEAPAQLSWSMKILVMMTNGPARMIKSSCHDPYGRCQLTRVNSTNVLDEGLRIGGRATTRDSGIEIGTRRTQVYVPAVEDRYILLAI
jgi:hypothetical protein